jgi:hypothetical protein
MALIRYGKYSLDLYNNFQYLLVLSVCGGRLIATESQQYLYSHSKYGDQNYDNKMECEWRIKAKKGKHPHQVWPSSSMALIRYSPHQVWPSSLDEGHTR